MSQPNPPGYRPPMPQYGKSQLTPEQQKRQRAIIGGVLGCFGVLILLSIVASVFAFKAVKGAIYTGPVDRAAMQQKMGSDVPLYPNGTIDETTTRAVLSSTGMMGGMMKSLGGKEPAAVSLETGDSESVIFDYYRRELTAMGWQEMGGPITSGGVQQVSYVKGSDQLMIQMQRSPKPGKRMVVLIRINMPGGARPGSEAPPSKPIAPSGGWPSPGGPGGAPPQFPAPPVPAPGQ